MRQGFPLPHAGRLDRFRTLMEGERLDAFVILDRANSVYFSGFPCSNSVIVVAPAGAWFFTDFRYLSRATADVTALEVRLLAQNTMTAVADLLRSLKPATVGFEGGVSFSRVEALRAACGRKSRLVEAGRLPARLRAVKDAGEIITIAHNQSTADRILGDAASTARPGMTELEIRRTARNAMEGLFVDEAFETIVASGPNSAFPHAVASRRKVRHGDFVTIDLGIRRDLYCSDQTRTVAVGEASARMREVYGVVLEAQLRALDAVRPGAQCREVDAVARDLIASRGFGDYFGHGLGHGVGLEIHEGPTLNPRSCDVLEEGMVVTVEPGVYVPGFGGVRIEDLVVVTCDGHRNLAKMGKRLRVVRDSVTGGGR